MLSQYSMQLLEEAMSKYNFSYRFDKYAMVYIVKSDEPLSEEAKADIMHAFNPFGKFISALGCGRFKEVIFED